MIDTFGIPPKIDGMKKAAHLRGFCISQMYREEVRFVLLF